MAVTELLDEEINTDWGPEGGWDLLAVRRMLLRMLQIRRRTAQLANLRKHIAEEYKATETKLEAEYNELRSNVQRYIELNDNEPVRLPDVGTAYLQGKDAKPRMVLANQEAAVSQIAQLPEDEQAAYYTKVFNPQAYLGAQQATIEAVLQGAAVDNDGKVQLADGGAAVVQTSGEVVALPPGVVLEVPPPVMALRPA